MAVDAARLHYLLEFGGNALFKELALSPSGDGDDDVPVTDSGHAVRRLVQRVADLRRKIRKFPNRRVLLKNDLTVLVRENLQRVAVTDNIGADGPVRMVGRGLQHRHGLRVRLRQLAAAQQRVDVGLELYLDPVLVDLDALDYELQVLLFELFLSYDVVKDLHGGLGGAVRADYRVAPVRDVLYLALQALYLPQEVGFQLVVGRLKHGLVFRVAHDVPHALAFRDLELLLSVEQHVL